MKHFGILIIILFPLLFSCKDILLNFASFDTLTVQRDRIQEYFDQHYLSKQNLAFANKTGIAAAWGTGGMPIIYILDENLQKIEVNNCYAQFDEYILSLLGENDELDQIPSVNLNITDEEILNGLTEPYLRERDFDFLIFYYWSYYLDQRILSMEDSFKLYESFNRGQSMIDSLDGNQKLRLIPVNMDFIKEDWTNKEIRSLMKSLDNG